MKNSKVTAIVDFFLIFFSFTMLVCSIISLKYIVNIKTVFHKIFQNWYQMPFEDIIGTRWRCPNEYFPLINYTIPGTNQSGYYDAVHDIVDTECRFINKCERWNKIPRMDINVWRNTTLCGKIWDATNYTYTVVPRNMDCNKGWDMCGIYDNNESKFCVKHMDYDPNYNKTKPPPIVKCPINHLKLMNNSEIEISIKNGSWPAKTNVIYMRSQSLVFSRNKNSTSVIPIDFRVSENIPCIIPRRLSNFSELFPFSNFTGWNYGCNIKPNDYTINYTLLDYRYKLLDTFSASEFYFNNDIDVFPDMKNWKNNKSQVFNLFYRPYVTTNNTCFGWGYDEETALDDKIIATKSNQFTLVSLYLVNLIFLSIFVSLLNLMKIQSKIQNTLISFIKLIFSSSFIIANFILINLTIGAVDYLYEREKVFNNRKCMDISIYVTYNEIYDLKAYVDRLYRYSTFLFFMAYPYTGLIILQVLKFIHKIYFRIRNMKRNKIAKNILAIN